MRTAIVALVTLLIGFALGWSMKPSSPARETAVAAAASPTTTPRSAAKTRERSVASKPTPKRGPRSIETLEHEVRQLTADNAAAKARIAELEGELDTAKDVTAQLEGEATPWPSDADPRFAEDAFLAALNESLDEEKLSGQVRGLDCTEFPCIAHGQLDLDNPRDREKLERLFEAMKAKYPGADFYLSQTVYSDDPNGDDPAQQRFSMSFYPPPEDEAAQRALNVRMRSRKNAYVDAE